MFTFVSKSDEEIQAMRNVHLLEEGLYSFHVKDIEVAMNKSGNQQLKVRLGVKDRVVTDYLQTVGVMIFKTKHFMECLGFTEQYNKGEIDLGLLVGRTGQVHIVRKKGDPRPDGGFFNDKNEVKDYVVAPIPTAEEKKMVEEFFSDEIKF